jgi:hypothetical protein
VFASGTACRGFPSRWGCVCVMIYLLLTHCMCGGTRLLCCLQAGGCKCLVDSNCKSDGLDSAWFWVLTAGATCFVCQDFEYTIPRCHYLFVDIPRMDAKTHTVFNWPELATMFSLPLRYDTFIMSQQVSQLFSLVWMM